MNKPGVTLFITVLAVFMTVSLGLVNAASTLTVRPGSTLPKVTLVDAEGKAVELAKVIRGKTVLLVYWSVTCEHCVKDVPAILRDYNLKKQVYRLVLVGGESEEMLSVARAFIKKQKLGAAIALFDPQRSGRFAFGDTLGLQYTPTILVVSREGRIVRIFEGNPGLTVVKRAVSKASLR